MKSWILTSAVAVSLWVPLSAPPSVAKEEPAAPAPQDTSPPAIPAVPTDTEVEMIVRDAVDRALNGPSQPGVGLPGQGPENGTASTAPTGAGTSATPAQPGTPPPTASPQSGPSWNNSYKGSRVTTPTPNPTGSSRYGSSKGTKFSRLPAGRTVPQAGPVPREFALAMERSIFIKGLQDVAPDAEKSTTKPSDPTTGPTTTVTARPEKTLLFNGVLDADGNTFALIEDTVLAKVIALKVGDPVARGRIAAITLGTLDYDVTGKVNRVSLGQNLDGEVIYATTRPSTMGSSPSAAPGGAGGGPGGSMAEIIERMRQRRMQESGGRKP